MTKTENGQREGRDNKKSKDTILAHRLKGSIARKGRGQRVCSRTEREQRSNIAGAEANMRQTEQKQRKRGCAETNQAQK